MTGSRSPAGARARRHEKITMEEAMHNKQLVRESIERVWGQQRLDEVDRLLAPDFVDHGALPGTPPGPAGFADGVRRLLAEFPDARNEIHEIIAEGDRVVVRWTMTGTQRGRRARHPGDRPRGPDHRDHDVADRQRADRRALDLSRRRRDAASARPDAAGELRRRQVSAASRASWITGVVRAPAGVTAGTGCAPRTGATGCLPSRAPR